MKITSVKAVPASTLSRGVARNYMFVKVETDEGLVGWGEATSGPFSVAAMVDEFGRELIGKDPGRIEEDWLKANPWRDDGAPWRPERGTIASMQETHWS